MSHTHIVGRSLHNGAYRIKAVLRHGNSWQVLLASHIRLNAPLVLKRIRADQPLPESVMAELDHVLSSGEAADHNAADDTVENIIPHSGGANTDRFLHEALLLARLRHPAIPTLYDYFFEGGYWYLAMEYISGPTFAEYLSRQGILPPREALHYAIQLCDLLDYLYAQSPPMSFQDLKLSSLILTPDGRLMFIDFAKVVYCTMNHTDDTLNFGAQDDTADVGQAKKDLLNLDFMLHELLSGEHTVGPDDVEAAEVHLNSIDENLKRRAIRVIPPTPVLMLDEPEESVQPVQPPLRNAMSPTPLAMSPTPLAMSAPLRSATTYAPFPAPLRSATTYAPFPAPLRHTLPSPPHRPRLLRRIIYACFTLALLLFLVMASLLINGRSTQSPGTIVLNPQGQPTTTLNTPAPHSAWQVLPSPPSPEADNTAAYVQVQGRAYVYMTGGYRGSDVPRYDHHLYRYDIAAAQWEVVGNTNFPGMVNNAVAVDGQNQLFFVSGYSSDTYTVTSLLYRYRPSDGTLEKLIPPPQMPVGFGAALLADQQGHLYVTQGFMQAGNPHALAGTGWYRYDIASGQWQALAPLPLGLGYVALALDGQGGIVMLGGAMDAGQHLPTLHVYRYDIMGNTWAVEQNPAPLALSGAASCADGHGHIVLVGGSIGYAGTHERVLNQTWLVDLHTLQWQPLATLPAGGSLLGTAVCDGNGHVFLERGANDASHPTADFLLLTIG